MFWNYKPSIIALTDGTARVSWIGDYDGVGNTHCIYRSPASSQFKSFGYKVNTTSINKINDDSAFFIVWNEAYANTNNFADSYTLSTIKTLNTTGNYVQLSNGATSNDMYVSSYKPVSVPYYFTTSNSIGSYYGLNKLNELSVGENGRTGVIVDNEAEFYFMLNDVRVDNQSIEFTDTKSDLSINDINTFNKYLETKPFTLNNSSLFTYSFLTGVTDSSAAIKALGKDGFIAFQLELIDNKNRRSYL